MPAFALGPLALALATSAAAAALPAVDAPITSVTVFSDRARVVRTGSASVSGGADRFELPLLGDRVEPESIRVECAGAELKRVEISHVDAEAFPTDEARALLTEIEALDDKIARTTGMRDAPQALLNTVRSLSPTLLPPAPIDALHPQPKLNPLGWGASLGFVDGWMERMQARVRQENDRLTDLYRERQRLGEKARILGGAQRRSGHRVIVVLGGSGKAKLTVTYMALSARWVPSYDIQLLPDSKRVQVAFAGLVSQETGEDWESAQLVLSTAVPATATVMPKLLTWKIGERERFIPTPVPVAEVVKPAPRAVPPLLWRDDAEGIKARLRQLAGMPVGQRGPAGGARLRGDYIPAQDEDQAKDKKKMEVDRAELDDEAPPPAPPAMAPSPEPIQMEALATKSSSVPMAAEESAPAARTRRAMVAPGSAGDQYRPQVPAEQVGLAPPPGYQPPYFGPDLPVSLAGGYDLSFPSVRVESITSGKEARRVALLSQQWPVEVERRLFPALAPEAYVTAEIRNPSSTALPGGQAQLAVGDDPAGTARLSVVASGERFTLPLGLDRAIKPVRNVKLVQSEKGVFSKDDVGEYTVTIEVANPYRVPLPLKVFDQLPLTDDKNVEIKPLAMDPRPEPQDSDARIRGALEWRITVPAAGKSIIRFGYSIRRPKSWRLHQ